METTKKRELIKTVKEFTETEKNLSQLSKMLSNIVYAYKGIRFIPIEIIKKMDSLNTSLFYLNLDLEDEIKKL